MMKGKPQTVVVKTLEGRFECIRLPKPWCYVHRGDLAALFIGPKTGRYFASYYDGRSWADGRRGVIYCELTREEYLRECQSLGFEAVGAVVISATEA
jgi:hypothetical protein